MGGYGIFGLNGGKAKPVYWINLPGRNTVLTLFGDVDRHEAFNKSIVASCSDDSCFVMDPSLFRGVCEKALRYLAEHTDWTRGKELPDDPSDIEVATIYLNDFIELTRGPHEFLVFYDTFWVHECGWPKEFSRVPPRKDMIDDYRWGGAKESYE